jgi:ubiquinone/menaquinone biosynthesis C-methylase UbiE
MSLMLSVRDLMRPRESVLGEVDIKPGFRVLDYGCGPGSYSICAARLVGDGGRVYAADIHPLAAKTVARRAKAAGLGNVETIRTSRETGLPDGGVDVVMVYDVFHHFGEPERLLGEFHRVLKPGGVLSFSDHHMKKEEIVPAVTGSGLFELKKINRHTYSFGRV